MSDAAFNEEFTRWMKSLGLTSVVKYGDNLPKDFLQLYHGKKLQNLCKFLMENVKDKNTASLVTGNLHVHNLSLENENTRQLCAKKYEELASANAKIKQLEERINKKKSNCCALDLQVSRSERFVLSEKVKVLLHEAHSKEYVEKLKSVTNHERHFKDICKQRLQKTSIASDDKPQFSSCCEEVKKLLMLVFDSYKSGFENNISCSGQNENFELWKASLNTLASYPGKMIVDALIAISKHDREKLSKYENKEDSETMKSEILYEPKPITAVQNMIQDNHKESLKELQAAVDNEALAAKTLTTIENVTHQIYQHMFNLGNVDEASKIFAAEAGLKGNEAYMHSLQQSAKTLQSQIDNDSLIQCEVKEMQLEMNTFDKQLARNRIKILQTTQQNSDFRKHMPDYQDDAITTAKTLLCNRQPEFGHLCSMLQDALKSELSALGDVDVSQLMKVNVDLKTVPIYDLSIHRPLKIAYETGDMSYQRTSALLGVHTVKSPSEFLTDVFHKKGLYDFYSSIENKNLDLKKKSNSKAKQVEDARAEVMSGRKLHMEKIEDRMRQGRACIGILAEEETKLEDTLNTWFDQPAQYQAPWLRLGGLDLGKWKQSKLSE